MMMGFEAIGYRGGSPAATSTKIKRCGILQVLIPIGGTQGSEFDAKQTFFAYLKRRLAPGVRYVTDLPPYE